MLLVTLHGGKPERNPHKNNVHAFDKDGAHLSSRVLGDAPGITLDELRGIYLFGGLLYAVNANMNENSVLCYSGSGIKYQFTGIFASRKTCAGILHPFDITFDDAGHAYLSSQDTNLVTRLKLSSDGKTGAPAPQAPALPASGNFSPGTFVASNKSLAPPTTPVTTPQGLEYSDDGAKKHSVRGVVWANGALYVADQPACRIKVYDRNGKFLGQSNGVESPVHLAVSRGNLYVSGSNEVFTAKLPNPAGNFELKAIEGLKVKNSSGMAFTKEGHFYVASRTENTIYKFDSDFKAMKFSCELPDNPEFLLHV